jgi:hypothetical protein
MIYILHKPKSLCQLTYLEIILVPCPESSTASRAAVMAYSVTLKESWHIRILYLVKKALKVFWLPVI